MALPTEPKMYKKVYYRTTLPAVTDGDVKVSVGVLIFYDGRDWNVGRDVVRIHTNLKGDVRLFFVIRILSSHLR